MTDARPLALALLGGLALLFLVGVRRVFVPPAGGHRYRASLVSGSVLLAEALAIAVRPVPPLRVAVAGFPFALSLGLFLWAARANRARPLRLAFSGQLPEHVQSDGPYRLVRHPFYASYLLAFAGGWIAAGTTWLAPAVLLGLGTYLAAARREEAAFERSAVRDAYRRYARQVGMFLPRPFPARD